MTFFRLFLPVLAALWACSAHAQTVTKSDYIITRGNDFVRYAGRITPQGVSEVTPLLSDGGHLIIQSHGGEEDAAVTLGNAILDQKIHVTLDGYCMSACANVILAAANGRLDGNGGAVIGFHWSSVAINTYAHDAGLTVPPGVPEISDRLTALYKRAGVDIRLLTVAAEKVGISVRPDGTRSAEKSSWFSTHQFWLPSDDALKRYITVPAGLTATGKRREVILRDFLFMTAAGDKVPNPASN